MSVPVFHGDKRNYENWKPAINSCVDQAPATPEYKLLQLRQYLSGEALKAIENLGHSGFAYESVKERLEQKYGVQRRKVMLHLDELKNIKPIYIGHPKDVEKFADLLDIAVINLKEKNRIEEFGNDTFHRKLLKKMPERMIIQYQRWVLDKENNKNIENLRSFVIQEAEFQMAAGLHRIGNKAKIDHTYFGSSQQSNKVKYQKKCVFCNLDHSLWDCVQFKQLDIRQRWDVARSNKLCYRCLGRSHYGEACTKTSICGINGCKKSQNRLLHRDKFFRTNIEKDEKKKEAPSITEEEQRKSNERSHTTTMHATKQPRVADEFVLQNVAVILKNGNRRLVVNALLDDGSTKTYVNSDIGAELNLKGTLERAYIGVLNGKSELLEIMPVELGFESIDVKVDMKNHAFTADRVTGNMKAINWRSFANKWNHLKGIAFPII